MAEQTLNYGLTKPDLEEFYDVEVQNSNMDIIDTALKNSELHLEQAVTKTTSNLTYFINTSSGNDNNDGLSNVTAFKTVQKALSILPQRINHIVNINLAPGTYAEDVVITTFDGNGQLRIVGGTSNLNADSFAINSISILNTNLDIRINYISVISTIKNTFVINNCSKVLVTGVVAITTSSFNGFTVTNSIVNIGSSVVSNKGKAIVSSASVVVSDVNTGADNLVALYGEYGGTIAKAGSQPNGVTAETTIYGGVIR